MSREITTPASIIRRALLTTAAAMTAALVFTPSAAFAAGGGGTGGHGGTGTGHSSPGKPGDPTSPSGGPVTTITKIVVPKVLTAAKTLSLTVRVSPEHRGKPGATPAETGTVTITVDGTAGTPLKLMKARVVEKLKLAVGKHTLSASYSGDAAHGPSEAKPIDITVG